MSVTIQPELDDSLSLNMANANFAVLCDLLGLPRELYGETDGQELYDRCTVATYEPVLHTTISDIATPNAPAARIIDCTVIPGLDNDYLLRKLDQLSAIARRAIELRCLVVWA